jgi:hypothetical protein
VTPIVLVYWGWEQGDEGGKVLLLGYRTFRFETRKILSKLIRINHVSRNYGGINAKNTFLIENI